MGVNEITVGMSHRGRLNVLSNVMGKPYRAIFHEFAGGATNPADVGGSGDVKYHLGTSTDREFDGNQGPFVPGPQSLAPRSGRSGRARQDPRGADHTRRQGRRYGPSGPASRRRGLRRAGDRRRMLRFLRACRATAPAGRSISSSTTRSASPPRRSSGVRSPYPSDIAKSVQSPILHVNGDDPEAVTFCLQAGDRVPPGIQPRHRHRHVVLSPLRPQ